MRELHGVNLTVVDLRSISPIDKVGLTKSVKKTGKCIVIDNDWATYGVSEITSILMEECFDSLDCPV